MNPRASCTITSTLSRWIASWFQGANQWASESTLRSISTPSTVTPGKRATVPRVLPVPKHITSARFGSGCSIIGTNPMACMYALPPTEWDTVAVLNPSTYRVRAPDRLSSTTLKVEKFPSL